MHRTIKPTLHFPWRHNKIHALGACHLFVFSNTKPQVLFIYSTQIYW